MSAILKLISKKRKQLHFSEENHPNYTKFVFACNNYIFPKTKANKNKQWTHYSAHKLATHFDLKSQIWNCRIRSLLQMVMVYVHLLRYVV